MLRRLMKGNYQIKISEHAFERAQQRKIHFEMIWNCIHSGKMVWFGRNRVKFEKKFKDYAVVCVDEIIGNKIKIATIEKR